MTSPVEAPIELTHFDDVLRPLFEGRKVICVGATVVSLVPWARAARRLGATDVLVVSMAGVGGPDPELAEIAQVIPHDLRATGPSMSIIRAEEHFKANPPEAIVGALSVFDPEREALVLGQFVNTVSKLDGRSFLTYRRPEWLAYEDKTIIDAFWDRAEVPSVSSIVCRVDLDSMNRAVVSLEEGSGVVFSGDTREGFNGGAEYIRWVRTKEDLQYAHTFFSAHCDQVRAMPFLEGIPCSIHGIVFPNFVAALRPVEMVTLRRSTPAPDENVFAYSGCASFYDPPNGVREAMISIAKQVGAKLREEIGFRGCFTVDGVVTADGFRPTELNPRQGAGIGALFGAYPGVPFSLTFDAITADKAPTIDPVLFESEVRKLADDRREGGTWRIVDAGVAVSDKRGAVFDVSIGWRWAADHEVPWALVSSGARGGQGFVRALLNDAVVPVGPSVSPLAASLWAFVDSELGSGVGPLTAAIAVDAAGVDTF
jgi:hypothetical protein